MEPKETQEVAPAVPGDGFCPDCGATLAEAGGESVCGACALFDALMAGDGLDIGAFGPDDPPDAGDGDEPVEVIGPYRLLRLLGEGAFGKVFLADQQQPFRRKVALKLIGEVGEKNSDVLARFESERQSLALMDHPRIASVFDAGETSDGRPFFAMEWVRGDPITNYCRARETSLEERLGIFLQLCAGVQHAHQKGVIHRDLKPSNVLVSEIDGKASVKVIDFGVAKALRPDADGDSMKTIRGQVIGTPQYMSPEQAAGRSREVDARSDVYSLGTILYELVTGSTPVEAKRFREADLKETGRLVCDVEPDRPSRRLAATASRGRSSHRKRDATRTVKALRQELDWIILRAIEKEPARRYETADALSRDIQRFLRDETVEAKPPSRLYRARKFVRRNRALAAGIAAVALALVAGTVVSSVLAVRATTAERKTSIQEKSSRARVTAETAPVDGLTLALDAAEADARIRGGEISPPVLSSLLHTLGRSKQLDSYGAGFELVSDIAISPDSRLVAYAHASFLYIVDRTTGLTQTTAPAGDSGTIDTLAFSPDGGKLALTDGDGRLLLLDTAGFETIREVAAHPDRTRGLAWTGDSSTLIACGSAGTVRFRTAGGKAAGEDFSPDVGPVHAVAFSPDRNRIAVVPPVGSAGRGAHLIDLEERTAVPLEAGSDVILALAFGPRGERLAGGGFDRMIRFWDGTGQPTGSLVRTGHRANITALAFHPFEDRILSGAEDNTVHSYSLSSGEPDAAPYLGHGEGIRKLLFAEAGGILVSSGKDGAVKVWDAMGMQAGFPVRAGVHNRALVFHPDGSRLVAAGMDGKLRAYGYPEGTLLFERDIHSSRIEFLLPVPGKEWLVSVADRASEIRLVEWEDGKAGEPWHHPGGKIRAAAVHPSGEEIFALGEDGSLHRLSLPGLGELSEIPFAPGDSSNIRGLAFAGNGGTLLYRALTRLESRSAPGFDSATGTVTRLAGGDRFKFRLALSPREDAVLTGGTRTAGGGRAEIFSLPGLAPVSSLEFPARRAAIGAFSPSGSEVVLGFETGHLQFFSRQGAPIGPRIMAHAREARGAAVHPGLPVLATSGEDGWIRFWHFGTDAWMRKARERLGRSPRNPDGESSLLERAASRLLTRRTEAPGDRSPGDGPDRYRVPGTAVTLSVPEGWVRFDDRSVKLVQKLVESVNPSLGRARLRSGFSRGERVELSLFGAPNLYVASIDEFRDVEGAAGLLPGIAGRFVKTAANSPATKGLFEEIAFGDPSWDPVLRCFRVSGSVERVGDDRRLRCESWQIPTRTRTVAFMVIGDPALVREAEKIVKTVRIDPGDAPAEAAYARAADWLGEALAAQAAQADRPAAMEKRTAAYRRYDSLLGEGDRAKSGGDLEKAADFYRNAAELCRGQRDGILAAELTPGEPLLELVSREARALLKLGGTRRAAGDLAATGATLQEGLDLLRPHIDGTLHEMVHHPYRTLLHEMAEVKRLEENDPEAVALREEAVAVARRIVEEQETPRSSRKTEWAWQLSLLSNAYRRSGNHGAAIARARKAVGIGHEIPAPHRGDLWRNRIDSAYRSLRQAGRAAGRPDRELAAAGDEIRMLEEWTAAHPGDLEGRWQLAEAWFLLGNTLDDQFPERRTERIEARRHALAGAESIHAETGGEALEGTESTEVEALWRRRFAKELISVAEWRNRQGEPDAEVLPLYDEAVRRARTAAVKHPGIDSDLLLQETLEKRSYNRNAREDRDGLLSDREERVAVLRRIAKRGTGDGHLLRLAEGLRHLRGPLRDREPDRAARLLSEARDILEDLPVGTRESLRSRTLLLQVLTEQFHAAIPEAPAEGTIRRLDAEQILLSDGILADGKAGAAQFHAVFYARYAAARWAERNSVGTVLERIDRYKKALVAFRRFEEVARPSDHMRQCAGICEEESDRLRNRGRE